MKHLTAFCGQVGNLFYPLGPPHLTQSVYQIRPKSQKRVIVQSIKFSHKETNQCKYLAYTLKKGKRSQNLVKINSINEKSIHPNYKLAICSRWAVFYSFYPHLMVPQIRSKRQGWQKWLPQLNMSYKNISIQFWGSRNQLQVHWQHWLLFNPYFDPPSLALKSN